MHLTKEHPWLNKCTAIHRYVHRVIEDITCTRMDMNFIFEWSTQYLMSSLHSLVRYRVEHEKIKFISMSEYVIFCLLYKHQWNTKSACFQRRDLLCNHNIDLYTCKDNMLSSHVKIWSFCGKAHLVFHWCLYSKSRYAVVLKCGFIFYCEFR